MVLCSNKVKGSNFCPWFHLYVQPLHALVLSGYFWLPATLQKNACKVTWYLWTAPRPVCVHGCVIMSWFMHQFPTWFYKCSGGKGEDWISIFYGKRFSIEQYFIDHKGKLGVVVDHTILVSSRYSKHWWLWAEMLSCNCLGYSETIEDSNWRLPFLE